MIMLGIEDYLYVACFKSHLVDVQSSLKLIKLKELIITCHISKCLLKPFQDLALLPLPIQFQ